MVPPDSYSLACNSIQTITVRVLRLIIQYSTRACIRFYFVPIQDSYFNVSSLRTASAIHDHFISHMTNNKSHSSVAIHAICHHRTYSRVRLSLRPILEPMKLTLCSLNLSKAHGQQLPLAASTWHTHIQPQFTTYNDIYTTPTSFKPTPSSIKS